MTPTTMSPTIPYPCPLTTRPASALAIRPIRMASRIFMVYASPGEVLTRLDVPDTAGSARGAPLLPDRANRPWPGTALRRLRGGPSWPHGRHRRGLVVPAERRARPVFAPDVRPRLASTQVMPL